MAEDTTTIEVKHDTYRALDIRKDVGESFDGAIRRLIGQVGPGVGDIEEDAGVEAVETVRVEDPPAGASCSNYDMIAGEACGEPATHLHTLSYEGSESEMYLCEEHAGDTSDYQS